MAIFFKLIFNFFSTARKFAEKQKCRSSQNRSQGEDIIKATSFPFLYILNESKNVYWNRLMPSFFILSKICIFWRHPKVWWCRETVQNDTFWVIRQVFLCVSHSKKCYFLNTGLKKSQRPKNSCMIHQFFEWDNVAGCCSFLRCKICIFLRHWDRKWRNLKVHDRQIISILWTKFRFCAFLENTLENFISKVILPKYSGARYLFM